MELARQASRSRPAVLRNGEVAGEEPRDLRLDACRGLALWFIFLDHVPNNDFAWLTLRNYGFSDTTEVFFFVSGFTCMLAYGRALQGEGWAATITRVGRRALEIYAAFLLTLLAYVAVVHLAGGGHFLDDTNTAIFLQRPAEAILRAGMMQYTPVNTDVLPAFVLLHLLFPIVLWLMLRSAALALFLSALLYIAVQVFFWNLPAWPANNWFFNPLAWQGLFVFGAWVAQAKTGWTRLRPLTRSWPVLALAVGYLVFGLAVTLSWQFDALGGWMPDGLAKLIYPIDKSNLSPLRLLHFLALAIIVAHFVPHAWRGYDNWLSRAVIRCGEHSLPIYCLGVLLSFAAQVVLTRLGGGIAIEAAISALGIGVMIAVATILNAAAKLDHHGPKLF